MICVGSYGDGARWVCCGSWHGGGKSGSARGRAGCGGAPEEVSDDRERWCPGPGVCCVLWAPLRGERDGGDVIIAGKTKHLVHMRNNANCYVAPII